MIQHPSIAQFLTDFKTLCTKGMMSLKKNAQNALKWGNELISLKTSGKRKTEIAAVVGHAVTVHRLLKRKHVQNAQGTRRGRSLPKPNGRKMKRAACVMIVKMKNLSKRLRLLRMLRRKRLLWRKRSWRSKCEFGNSSWMCNTWRTLSDEQSRMNSWTLCDSSQRAVNESKQFLSANHSGRYDDFSCIIKFHWVIPSMNRVRE